MKLYKYNGTGNNGTFSWLIQRISGVVLLFAISYHFFGMITGKYDGLLPFVLGLILIFGVWHGINGLKMITDDYVSSLNKRVILLFTYWTIGLIIIIQGLSLFP